MRQVLVKVWQKKITPEQALMEFARAGPLLGFGKEKEVLELLLALSEREITTTEAEEELYETEQICQI